MYRATAQPALPNSKTANDACSACSTFKKSGKVSCCAPGGSWFNKCGSAGNLERRHTWYEGIQACNSVARASSREAAAHAISRHKKALAQPPNATRPLNAPGTPNITQSQDANGARPRKSTGRRDVTQRQEVTQQQKVVLPQEVTQSQRVTYPLEANQSKEVDQKQPIDWPADSETYADTADLKGRIKLAKLAASVSLLFSIFQIHVLF